jgi:ribosomal-protein-alanine N-acetyltransferase
VTLAAVEPIRTARLTVRPIRREDLADLFEINGDDEVTAFLPYATWRNADDGVAWFERMAGFDAAGSARQLVVERASDGKIVGTALVFKHDAGSARVELGYVIGRAHWRQGYAKEALAGLCAHAFERMAIRRIEAEVDPDNVPSNALLRALGFTLEGRLRERWTAKERTYDTNLYGLLRGDPSPREN